MHSRHQQEREKNLCCIGDLKAVGKGLQQISPCQEEDYKRDDWRMPAVDMPGV